MYNTILGYNTFFTQISVFFFLILQFIFILYLKKLKKNKRNACGLNKEVSQVKLFCGRDCAFVLIFSLRGGAKRAGRRPFRRLLHRLLIFVQQSIKKNCKSHFIYIYIGGFLKTLPPNRPLSVSSQL